MLILVNIRSCAPSLFWTFVRYCHDPHTWNNEGINLPTNSKEL